MNMLLDSHVEALAFNYLNFAALTILNNLWTWLALLTAALSFWRIRSSSHPVPKHNNPVAEPLLSESQPLAAETEAPAPRKILTAVVNGGSVDVDGVTKGKFTVYYYNEEEDMQCSGGEREEVLTAAFDGGEGCETEWWKCWETVLRVRNGESEKGWYTCQDLTELNGNVVRLWDGGLRLGVGGGGGGSFTRETCLNSNSMMIRC